MLYLPQMKIRCTQMKIRGLCIYLCASDFYLWQKVFSASSLAFWCLGVCISLQAIGCTNARN